MKEANEVRQGRHGMFVRAASKSVKSISVVSVVVGKNQTRVPQPIQQFWMFVCKELESSGFVRLNAGNIQHNCGEAGNLRIVRLRHVLKAGHILFRDVRLLEESEDVVLVLNGLALALRPGLATLAHMDFVTGSKREKSG